MICNIVWNLHGSVTHIALEVCASWVLIGRRDWYYVHLILFWTAYWNPVQYWMIVTVRCPSACQRCWMRVTKISSSPSGAHITRASGLLGQFVTWQWMLYHHFDHTSIICVSKHAIEPWICGRKAWEVLGKTNIFDDLNESWLKNYCIRSLNFKELHLDVWHDQCCDCYYTGSVIQKLSGDYSPLEIHHLL